MQVSHVNINIQRLITMGQNTVAKGPNQFKYQLVQYWIWSCESCI